MPQDHHTKAAELHEAAAQTHRSASELHMKKDDKAGLDHANKAKMQSDDAGKATMAAHSKSSVVPAKA
jgi:hypothetical protein